MSDTTRGHSQRAGVTSAAAKRLRDPAMQAMIDAAVHGRTLAPASPPIPTRTDLAAKVSTVPAMPRDTAPAQTLETHDGFMVVDVAGGDLLPETFAKTPKKATQLFCDLEWEDIRERELGIMSGRYHVRHVRLELLESYRWPDPRSADDRGEKR